MINLSPHFHRIKRKNPFTIARGSTIADRLELWVGVLFRAYDKYGDVKNKLLIDLKFVSVTHTALTFLAAPEADPIIVRELVAYHRAKIVPRSNLTPKTRAKKLPVTIEQEIIT